MASRSHLMRDLQIQHLRLRWPRNRQNGISEPLIRAYFADSLKVFALPFAKSKKVTQKTLTEFVRSNNVPPRWLPLIPRM